jgi:hypothetical protein
MLAFYIFMRGGRLGACQLHASGGHTLVGCLAEGAAVIWGSKTTLNGIALVLFAFICIHTISASSSSASSSSPLGPPRSTAATSMKRSPSLPEACSSRLGWVGGRGQAQAPPH